MTSDVLQGFSCYQSMFFLISKGSCLKLACNVRKILQEKNWSEVALTSSSSSYGSTTFSAKFWPSQPVSSIFFYPGQGSSNLALLTFVYLF
jgi:hypothetical protein